MRNTTIVWFAAVLFIGVALTALSRKGALAPIEGTVATVFSPLRDGLQNTFSPVTNFLSDIGETDALREENQGLREENERIKAELVRLREQKDLEQELSKLLEVERERTEFTFQVAHVVAQDPSSQRQVVAVNRGTDDGIKVGMVAVGPGGSLLGRVTKVLSGYSWITLISDPRVSVNVKVQGTGAAGVISGQQDFSLSMELVAEGSSIQVSDNVVTSGLGGIFPESLYVGVVSEVQGTPQDLFLTVKVEPAVRLNRIENLLLITNFLPITLDEGQ